MAKDPYHHRACLLEEPDDLSIRCLGEVVVELADRAEPLRGVEHDDVKLVVCGEIEARTVIGKTLLVI